MDDDALSRGLKELAAAAPVTVRPGAGPAARRRARTVRRRRAAAGVVGAAAGVALLVPVPGLLRPDPAPQPLAQPGAGQRYAATFGFPDQAAVAEVLPPTGPVVPGVAQRLVVRVRTAHGRPAGVDVTFGDGRAQYLDGGASCAPEAGPTTVDLVATHAWARPGTYTVRASPQVVLGCDGGTGRFSTAGTTRGSAVVRVGPDG